MVLPVHQPQAEEAVGPADDNHVVHGRMERQARRVARVPRVVARGFAALQLTSDIIYVLVQHTYTYIDKGFVFSYPAIGLLTLYQHKRCKFV